MAAVHQDWTSAEARDAARSIVRILRGDGHEAYFAGGCVRDELLGREPTDYDIATDARPDKIQSLFRRTAAVGASFGVVLVKHQGVTVEVATFRSDGPYSDSRRPDHIEFAGAREDANRRDFTVNALFLDPLGAEDAPSIHGHVIDHVGGMADLDARVIRAVGDPAQRLGEDHLRALRAVRFAARFGFSIERGTANAIREHASDLGGVSRERVGDELRRMMRAPTRADASRLIGRLGLDRVLFGRPSGRPEEGELGDALAGLGDEGSFVAALAALAFDRGEMGPGLGVPAIVRAWRRGMCLTNEETDLLRAVLDGVARIEEGWSEMGVASRKRIASSGWFADGFAVLRARDGNLGRRVAEDVHNLGSDGIGLAPDPFIDGNDLLELALPPGPVFARVLERVYDAQLEGEVVDRSSALSLAAELGTSGSV